jgi:hypothetical protein
VSSAVCMALGPPRWWWTMSEPQNGAYGETDKPLAVDDERRSRSTMSAALLEALEARQPKPVSRSPSAEARQPKPVSRSPSALLEVRPPLVVDTAASGGVGGMRRWCGLQSDVCRTTRHRGQ